MTYTVKVIETRKLLLNVEANSEAEALEKANAEYFEHLLDYDACFDVDDTSFELD